MRRYVAVAIVAVSIVLGTLFALLLDRGDIALGMLGLGGSLAIVLGAHGGGPGDEKGRPL